MNRQRLIGRAAAGLLAVVIGLGVFSPAWAQTAAGGSLTGKVTTLDGQPVADAQVRLVELNRRTSVDEGGTFRFENVPAGSYLLEAVSRRLGTAVERVRIAAGATVETTLALDVSIHREEILVTAGAEAHSRYEIAQPASVLSDDELQERLQPTLGETLSQEPGVSSTFFGQGASRPVIRGIGGDRIRVLETGLGAGDASTTSPDHAVSIDPFLAERIEVVRGPATLLYGSSAVGGVVNVIDSRIPGELPAEKLTGTVELRGGSASDERGGGAQLAGGAGRLAWHVDFLKRETDDYEIPGFAESQALRDAEEGEGGGEEEEHEEAFGLLPNSATDTESGAVGLSYVGENGFLGASVSGLDTLYGIPGGHHHEEGEGAGEGGEPAEEAAVRIDLKQRRYDLRGGFTRPFGPFRGANVRFGVTDYEHVELEGEEIGTRFTNDGWEGRFELLQNRTGSLSGSVGLQILSRDFEAIGAEAFVPPTQTDSRAVFAFEEVERGPWRLQFGARYERQDVTATTAGVNDRSFNGLSGSFGLIYGPGEDYSLGISVARSTKLPNAEELFSNGPHIATNAFEIGDPNLDAETSLGLDLTLRKTGGPLKGEITLFGNRFDSYIFEQATDEEEDGLPVFRYVQRDAEFYGAELSGVAALFHDEPNHVDLEIGADFVRAELRDTGEPLPRIPPRRYRLGLHYQGDKLQGRIEGIRAEKQDRVSELELPTAGYTLLNASVGYTFFTSRAVYDVLLRGTNLTDEEARNHVSFLKDLVPLPGRDVSLSLRVSF
jgi:iron complex outermembrane receptor protein